MSTDFEDEKSAISRRDCLKGSAMALGAASLAGLAAAAQPAGDGTGTCVGTCYPTNYSTDQYSYYGKLPKFTPGTPLQPDEMRITFMGSTIPPCLRVAQKEMSVFVEVGWVKDEKTGLGHAEDQFVFDCGSGSLTNYSAMGVGYERMDKVFLCHLHGDHMNDLTHIYTFGPSGDRKSPLYVWGPGASSITYVDPLGKVSGPYDDGLTTYCQMLRAACRWHSESFSFLSTGMVGTTKPTDWGITIPDPVKDPRAPYDNRYNQPDYIDDPLDGYALVPIELPYDQEGVAYNNSTTRAKVTHFPVVHARRGSIGYKLEWQTPDGRTLTMIYTSDTRPETVSINQAINKDENGVPRGVDVFIHEMIVPAEVWVMKVFGLKQPLPYGNPATSWWDESVNMAQTVQNSSHTPQGAFGYLLSQIRPRPRLTVATHFPVADDTVACAYNSVREHCPDIGKLGERLTWSFDLMVIRLNKRQIVQQRAVVPVFGFGPRSHASGVQNPPKYWMWGLAPGQKTSDPYAQIDTSNVIQPGDDTYCPNGY